MASGSRRGSRTGAPAQPAANSDAAMPANGPVVVTLGILSPSRGTLAAGIRHGATALRAGERTCPRFDLREANRSGVWWNAGHLRRLADLRMVRGGRRH